MRWTTHTVKQGDTLSSISQEHYGHPYGDQRILRANSGRVSDPSSLNPGTILHIPY